MLKTILIVGVLMGLFYWLRRRFGRRRHDWDCEPQDTVRPIPPTNLKWELIKV